MPQRSSVPSAPAGALVGDGRDLPASRRRRARRRALIGSIAIGALVLATAVIAVAALGSVRQVPAASLTAPVEADATAPVPSPSASEATATAIVTETVAGQQAWLAVPATAPVGVAYLLPDGEDDPAELVQGTAAQALKAQGWAIASATLGGQSWGSPASSTDLAALRTWVITKTGDLPVVYVGVGMGGTVALMSMVRDPASPVACMYAVAPVTDLVAAVAAQPTLGDRIVSAWGSVPTAEQNPILSAPQLSTATTYRIVIPAEPASRTDDARAFAASLAQSGHDVSSVDAPQTAATSAAVTDLISFVKGCRA